ncbi:MAG TPA: hypothetical protein VMO20_09740 [Candidatus Acidoferrum sp.]|nr:hypothetical protein [Candidatus Acidoferrum sp.]
MRLTDLSADQLRHAANLQDKIQKLQKKLDRIVGKTTKEASPRKRRKMSAAARRKIAAAQKARWAMLKAKP